MAAEHVDRAHPLQQNPHLVIRYLPLRLERRRSPATGEPEPDPLDLHRLAVYVLETVGQAGAKTARAIHIPMDDKAAPPFEGHSNFPVLGVDRLPDLRPDLIGPSLDPLGPEVSHPMVVAGSP